jgi:hypothetical protein
MTGGDDRTAIQNAINAAYANDTVYLPAGTYRVSRPVSGKSGVCLEGTTGAVLFYIGSSVDCILALCVVSDVVRKVFDNIDEILDYAKKIESPTMPKEHRSI